MKLTPRVSSLLALLMLGCWMVLSAAAAQSLEVIELKHRTADEIIPVLQPLLESGGALTGQDYRLFVRASAANLKQLRDAIAAIDQQPRQLKVSVRRTTQEEMQRERGSVSATVRAGDGSTAVNEGRNNSPGVTIRGTSSTTQHQSDGVTSVLVLEGGAAFIATGESVPIVSAVAGRDRRGAWVAGSVDYRNLSSGFLATPRVAGERVTLQIEQQTEQRNRTNNSEIQTQHLATQVNGRLGEWLQLGGIEESTSTQQQGTLSRRYSTQSDSQSVWVKVELMER